MGLIRDLGYLLRTGHAPGRVRFTGDVREHSTYELLIPEWARYNEAAFTQHAYRTNPVVFQSIEYFARSIAIATMYAWREGPRVPVRQPQGNALQVLLRRPSKMYKTQTRFIRQVIRKMFISGECIIYMARDSSGTVRQLQILPSAKVTVVPARVGISHYLYRPTGVEEPIRLEERDVIFLKFDDPEDPLRGCSPLAVAWRETQTDNSTTDYRKAFFDNAAIPGGVLTTQQGANADQLRQWSEDFTDKFSGAKNAGKTPALAGGLEYKKAGATPGEIDFANVTALSETRICMAFGITPILIAAKAGLDRSTYSNFNRAREAFWQDTAVPLMGLIEDDFTHALTSETDTSFCSFDTSKVPALQEDTKAREERARHGLVNAAITVNEYREIIGLNPISDGDVYYRGSGMVVVPAGELNVKPEPVAPEEDEEEDGETDEGGRPPTDDKDRAPTENSADRAETPPLTRLGLGLKTRLMDLKARQEAGGAAFDYPLHVARVSGEVRKPLARMVKAAGASANEEWLDQESINLGNDLVRETGTLSEVAYKLAAEYERRAEDYADVNATVREEV